jgi:hypothetical protein
MKKVIVGYSAHLQEEYTAQFEIKKKAFNECLAYCETFLPIEDLKAFSDNMKAYFLNEWELKHSASFPPMVSILKQLEFSEVQLSIIEAYQKQYESIEIEFNTDNQEPQEIDFNIYATTPEQIERYAACDDFINAVERLQKSGANVLYGGLCQSMYRVLTIDYATNRLSPVHDFIFTQH